MISHHIVQHIVQSFGIPAQSKGFTLLDDMYKLPETLTIDVEGDLESKSIWAAQGQIGNSIIKLIVADLSIDDEQEYVLLCQLDELSLYVLQFNLKEIKENRAHCFHNESTWVEISNLILARLLVGIEQLNELYVNYIPMKEYKEVYSKLLEFLKREE